MYDVGLIYPVKGTNVDRKNGDRMCTKFTKMCLSQWRYCIRLENMGSEVVQLRERHWRIFSLSGTLETVRGRGVVGRVSSTTASTQRNYKLSMAVSEP